MKYDLLIKDGTVVDPSQGLNAVRDVALDLGKVAAVGDSIPADSAREVLDARGLIVTPGLIDLHVHSYWGASTYGIDPDVSNLAMGVTTALDAGSAGALTFPAFRRHTIDKADTRLYALLNISAMGMVSPKIGELEDLRWADVALAVESGRKNRDRVLGIKARLGRHLLGESSDVEALKRAIEAAEGFDGFVMIHVGASPSPLPKLMSMLRPGDVVTHSFHGFEDGVLEGSGAVVEGMKEAQARGVVIDLGHGAGGFSFKAAEKALANGVVPDTISTDIHNTSIEGPVYDFATTLTKLMHLGMSLEEVVKRSTETPARVMGLGDRLGMLKVGAEGDVTVLRVEDGRFKLVDRLSPLTKLGSAKWEPGTTVEASKRLVHVHTIKGGAVYRPWMK
ncbi:MAG: amidohydrolase/deacetylase family metallohydrolase [Chloroflexi bacterium]|nr:amidohydrolase/deacetylase family metallohydrolase [Chloroflexota bacterium]